MAPTNRTNDHIPTELVRLVLRHVKVNSSTAEDRAFFNALTVCTLWNAIGEDLLYTDIAITSSAQLANFSSSSERRLLLTRSLSVKLPASDSPARIYARTVPNEPQGLDAVLSLLAQLANRMGNLESFSLRMLSRAPRWATTVKNGHAELCVMLNALPKSLRYLEIDIASLAYTQCTPTRPLCVILRDLVGRLADIRLRLPGQCSQLFPRPGVANSTLEEKSDTRSGVANTIIVNLINADFIDEYGDQGSIQAAASAVWMPQQELIRRAASSIEAGLSASVGRFSVCSVRNRPQVNHGAMIFSAINEQRLAPGRKVLKSPFKGVNYGKICFVRYKNPGGRATRSIG